LQEAGALDREVILLLVSDEEVGSESSRPLTEAIAKKVGAVFVLEPGQGIGGAAKTWRKGVGEFVVRVHGVASHSGVDFTKGQSAIIEMAHQILKIKEFTDLKRGLTVNPGTITGGTRTNVIAEYAECHVDLRVQKMADAARIEKKMMALRPKNRHCKIEVEGGMNRPPMERSKGVLKLYGMARDIASEIGFPLKEEGTGGGSDGNFTAALGIPTLDGLGGVGEGAHAAHESILLDELPRRTALLAGLIQRA
jgi:glutamate carboxypeptidase